MPNTDWWGIDRSGQYGGVAVLKCHRDGPEYVVLVYVWVGKGWHPHGEVGLRSERFLETPDGTPLVVKEAGDE